MNSDGHPEIAGYTGSTFTEGVLTGEVKVPTEPQAHVYTRHGELFAKLCAVVAALATWLELRGPMAVEPFVSHVSRDELDQPPQVISRRVFKSLFYPGYSSGTSGFEHKKL